MVTEPLAAALARFLMAPPPRDLHPDDVQITGKPTAIRAFLKSIEVFPPVPSDAQA